MENIANAAPSGNVKPRFSVNFLTSAQEATLAERNRSGDIAARNQLVASHFPLVSKVAKRYRRAGVEWDDLLSEGKLGLFRAAETFDPERGARFSTYATWWVKASISEFVERSRSVVKQSYRNSKIDKSLNEPVFDDDGGKVQRLDLVEESQAYPWKAPEPGPWNRIASKRNADELTEMALAPLNERERQVFEARHLGDEPKTLREIGAELGISRERARQIDAVAIRKARDAIEPAITAPPRKRTRDHDAERFLGEYYRYCTRRQRKENRKKARAGR